MANNIHRGTELNNVKETWEENEKKQVNRTSSGNEGDLDQVIKEESSEYDKANKEERLLGGDRGSVKDEDA